MKSITVQRRAKTSQAARPAIVALCALVATFAGCSRSEPTTSQRPQRLSQYGLFEVIERHIPAKDVIPYDINSALFSDYTAKYRFVRLPKGAAAKYDAENVFDFPVGTTIVKTFTMPHDLRDPSKGERRLETRLLIHEPDGWVALPYIWNDSQTDATLEVAGGTIDVEWVHTDGAKRTNNYMVPNVNQCKGCHAIGDKITPIGPAARHLNRDFAYDDGTENQLRRWSELGILEGAPAPEEAPKLAVWNDPSTGSLDERARAWLEINCAHCHRPDGPARNSGLDLLASQQEPVRYGVLKPPVAAGRGSGGLAFDIVPGEPDESILVYRISSTHPDVMMPELGKRLPHDEGIALVREWIAGMAPVDSGG